MAGYIESPAQVVARRARQRAQKAAKRAAIRATLWEPGTPVVDPDDYGHGASCVRGAA